jgi:three-Cys-motif partner protein
MGRRASHIPGLMPKIDLSNYVGKEQAYVKHYLLDNYLSQWAYKIGSKWDRLVFVDGFAGPWEAHDESFADSSFGIAVRVLNKVVDDLGKVLKRQVGGLCVFVEKRPEAFRSLDAFAKAHCTELVVVKALEGRFIENIPAINKLVTDVGGNSFKFVFLDQKGWAATPIAKLKPFVRTRRCEVLFNLMTSFLTRFIERDDLAQSYHDLFGRTGVVERIRSLPRGTGQREDAAVEEYCKSLRDICGFPHVSQAVIMDPTKEKIRYHLIFATNSLHGIEVFKRAEKEAAEKQNEIRSETKISRTSQPGLPFASEPPESPKMLELRKRYSALAREKLIARLTRSDGSEVPYAELYSGAMTFPLTTPDDLIAWLEALKPHISIHLEGKHRKKLRWDKHDFVVVNNPAKLS